MKTAFSLAATAVLFVVGALHAEEIRPIQAARLELGTVSGVAYYTSEADGFHVVATLADQQSKAIRVRVVLASGESVTITTPGAPGQAEKAVVIARDRDALTVEPAAAYLN